MQWLRPLRNVLSRLRNLRSPQCTLTPKVSSQVYTFSTATTPAAKEPSQRVRDLPQDTPSPPQPRSSNASRREFPQSAGIFIQMEDELAASIAIQGAVWGGAKAFTVTSGPGFSLMMEHIGYAAMTETPCVFVNVQRGGPSTGLPTLPAQADMMQARWGSHGDYGIIALCPNSPQECFDLTITASTSPRIPRPGYADDRRMRGPHDRESGDSRGGRRSRSSAPPHPARAARLPAIRADGRQVPEMAHAGEG